MGGQLSLIYPTRPVRIIAGYPPGGGVDDMAQATAMWKSRGVDVREITPSSGTKAILSNIYDPNGVRMELLQLPPESLHAQATNCWK
jgi:tripartite-type tricarboxylate transporter receptor subunit TctC